VQANRAAGGHKSDASGMTTLKDSRKSSTERGSERKLGVRHGQNGRGDGALVVTSRRPQKQRRLTQMLISGFMTVKHPEATKMESILGTTCKQQR
jgi:hypothetical protein